jgi:hypothetical protein
MEERTERQWREGIVLADPQRHLAHSAPYEGDNQGNDDDAWNDNEILEVQSHTTLCGDLVKRFFRSLMRQLEVIEAKVWHLSSSPVINSIFDYREEERAVTIKERGRRCCNPLH